ncbi:hypothetical protein QOT17_006025 [Balamuthia mandrillaris]
MVNEDQTFARLTATKWELYSAEHHIQELDHAYQPVEQKNLQYLSKLLDCLEPQTFYISYLIEAVNVLLEHTNKSIFKYYETTIMDTLIHIVNKVLDCLECIELNQVVKAQWQQHTEPEKVKEGKESLFFDSPPHVHTPYHAADTSFTELFFDMTYLFGLSIEFFQDSDSSIFSATSFSTITTFITVSFTSFASLWHQLAIYKQTRCYCKVGSPGLDIDDNDDVKDDCEDIVELPIMASILLNCQCATAFIDFEASHSFISPAVAEKSLYPASCEHHYTVISHIDNIEITLDDKSTTHVACCAAHVYIDCGSCKLYHHFFIMLL